MMGAPEVRPIRDVLVEVERAASDAAWDGDTAREQVLNATAQRLRERIAAGEDWEPLF